MQSIWHLYKISRGKSKLTSFSEQLTWNLYSVLKDWSNKIRTRFFGRYLSPKKGCLQQLIKNTRFFYKQHFYSNIRLKLEKSIKQKLSNTLRLSFCYLKIIHILYPRYHPKVMVDILKNKPKDMNLCIHKIIRLIIMKMRIKIKNRSHRYEMNIPRSRNKHRYSKYKKCLCMVMPLCMKQHKSNMPSSIYEKVKRHWSWVEKKHCLKKKR